VRARSAHTAFPQLDFNGFVPTGVYRHRVAAPLQLVLDNFVEVEHTSFVHALLGYAAADLASVEVAMSTGHDWVRVVNQGRQRKLPLPIRAALGIGATDTFVDDWTTYFSPIYSGYDHYWLSPEGSRRENALRTFVFFNPIDDQNCELWSFAGASSRWLKLPLLRHGLRGLLRLSLELEVRLDRRQLESLADKNTSMRGMKLGRFDRVMWETRTRVASIYNQTPGEAG
jgi:vanillate O-demethylase monooxygenase subunit